MTRTYTYTAADYREVFGGRTIGFVGVDPDGDLIWVRHNDIVWAYETLVLDNMKLNRYTDPNEVIYSPSALMKDDFDARQTH